jgi:hypothetical protein
VIGPLIKRFTKPVSGEAVALCPWCGRGSLYVRRRSNATYACSAVQIVREDPFWGSRGFEVNPTERLFMKFFSLRTNSCYPQDEIAESSRLTVKDFNDATLASLNIHTYAELRQQFHNDLRIQHPEWIEPSGESPMCDFYEARLMDLLGAEARGLN